MIGNGIEARASVIKAARAAKTAAPASVIEDREFRELSVDSFNSLARLEASTYNSVSTHFRV